MHNARKYTDTHIYKIHKHKKYVSPQCNSQLRCRNNKKKVVYIIYINVCIHLYVRNEVKEIKKVRRNCSRFVVTYLSFISISKARYFH